MVRIAYKKVKHFIVTLRFSILSIFVTLFAISIVLIVFINYMSSSRIMLFAAETLMHHVSASLHREFSSEIETAARDSALSAQLIEHKLLNVDKISEVTDYTYDLAYRFNLVQSAYWGDAKGNYVITEYEPNDSLTTTIIDRTKTPATKTMLYRDVQGKIIKRVTAVGVNFDPRHRPWYLQADANKKTLWTDVYIYEPKRYLGITIATPVYYPDGKLNGVFGLDIRLDWLSWYVDQHKISPNGVTFIVTTAGKLIAFPNLENLKKPVKSNQEPLLMDIHSLTQPGVSASFDIYKKNHQSEFTFDYEGETYLAVYSSIPYFAMHGWLIAVVVPKDDFISELKKSSILDVGMGLIILLLGILLVSALITQVVKPIKRVVKQIDKIKNFNLSKQHIIHSRIEEVILLSDAVQALRSGLKSFRKYVPASLVRKLIQAGEDARIGGTKKKLTIFFSDIENFTSLAEHLDPNLLMEHMCEYFDELSQIILSEKGTIDKYIGDSLMAFWGAPLLVDHPFRRAASAALTCMRRLDELNSQWQQAGKAPFITRIGLHVGTAIVGNIGSSKRLNYTALGDAVNVASRLEGINKIYGTRIIVSDALYQLIKGHFVLRKIDCVAVKGKIESTDIYELLAEKKEELSFDIDVYNQAFAKAFAAYQEKNWDKAISDFAECLKIYPQDSVAPVLIKRCQDFKSNLPPDWDGVWRVKE